MHVMSTFELLLCYQQCAYVCFSAIFAVVDLSVVMCKE
jgi:hypothetical protein